MIDLHSHVLFGIDDGPDDLAGSLAICRAAVADGITVIAATPHVREDYPATTARLVGDRLGEVQAAVGDELRLLPGGEVDLEELDRPHDELMSFALAGNPRYLLVETPYVGWPLDFGERLFRLAARGVRAVIAHPERNEEVSRRPELLEPLASLGALFQLTAAAVDGRLGSRAQRTSRLLIERGYAHLIASDAHEPRIREIGMSRAAAAVGDEALARYLTVDVPASIVERRDVPARPEPAQSRWFPRRRTRRAS